MKTKTTEQKTKPTLNNYWLTLGVVVGLLIITVLYLERMDRRSFQHGERISVVNKLSTVRARLEGVINGNLLSITGLITLFSLNPDTTQEEFSKYAALILEQKTQIRNIAAARDLVITHMYPTKGNEKALGLDYRKNAAQKNAAIKAIEVGGIFVAGPVNLVQGGRGFIARTPIYEAGGDDNKNRDRFWGLISAVIDVDKLYFAAGLSAQDLPIEIAIRGQDSAGAQGGVFYGRGEIFDDNPVLLDVFLPHGSWQLAAVPIGGWTNRPPDATVIRSVGAIVLLVIVGLMSIRQRQEKGKERVEKALRGSEARLRNILDNSPLPIYFKDVNGRFLEANSQFEKNYDVKFEDIYGKTILEVFPDERGKLFLNQDIGVLNSRKAVVNEEHLGEKTFVTLKFPILDDEGSIIGIGGIETDITERKLHEKKIHEANEQTQKINNDLTERSIELTAEVTKRQLTELALIEAKSVAEKANLAKSEFLANMSHELRTPLNSIIGFSQMLEAETFGPLGSDQNKEYIEIIHNSGEHLHRIIGDILDLSKIEAGEEVLSEDKVDVGEVVEECLEMVSDRAARKRLEFPAKVEADLPYLQADRLKVKQILLNLLSNAIKFTPEDGRVKTKLFLNDYGSIVIKIIDTGAGIAPEDLKKVMEPFGQAGDTYTRSHEGSGLGLALVKSQMALHGGTVDIKSQLGDGTIVTISFPSERTLTI